VTFNLNPDRYPPLDSRASGQQAELATTTSAPVVVGSPEWWLERLLPRLVKQASYCRDHWAYYEGDQPLAFASEKFEAAYGRRYRGLPANFMPLVVEAEKERLIVQGFRFGDALAADKSAWQIWQRNNLDAESQIAHELTLAKGASYTLVTPQPGASAPLVTIEDPEQVVLETLPGNRRIRLAALKAWRDEDGFLRAYLYLPEYVYKYRSRSRASLSTAVGASIGSDGSLANNPSIVKASSWQPELPGDEDFPITNTLGVVPVVPLLNRPTLSGAPRSEIAAVTGNQNAINFIRFAALIGSDVAALPQRWAKNLDLEVDPDTGAVKVPFRSGVDNLWTTRRPTEEEVAAYGDKYPATEFGQFPAADLSPFVALVREEIAEMSSISRTPYHYLLGVPHSVPPTGESIKSSEAPLVRKTRSEAVHLGEGWEETMRVALVAAGQRGKARADAETMWEDFETRNEAARTDSILKQYEAGLLPDEFAWEELGYSAQQIARIKELRAQQPPAPVAPPEPPPPEA